MSLFYISKSSKSAVRLIAAAAALLALIAGIVWCGGAVLRHMDNAPAEPDIEEPAAEPDTAQTPTVHEKTEIDLDKWNGMTTSGEHIIDGVPYLSQWDGYPTGCESVSAVMALRYAGIDITVDEFIEDYLDMGDVPRYYGNGGEWGEDPDEVYLGDPRTESGYGCYPPVIENAINKFADKSRYAVENCGGLTLEALCVRYIDNDIPVMVWATIYMEEPRLGETWRVYDSGKEIDWIIPMHCLLLVGYDEDNYYFNDPYIDEYVSFPKYSCETAYAAQHSRALAVYPYEWADF